MSGPRAGVYPGTFDPIHNGHLDVIRRATRVVDRLVLGVAVNIGKDPLFDLEDRVQMVEEEARSLMNGNQVNGCKLEVRAFENLLVDFARSVDAMVVIRGLRAISDFEYEFQMAATNARLCPQIETIFLPASETNQFISSRFVKEIARLHGDLSSFVSGRVRERLESRSRS
ncbi:MAG: pantetheine-phosphate adenylyltransferase [Pseudomonadota bacterium]